nr:GntR family transcriptional regulator [Tissierella sp.]
MLNLDSEKSIYIQIAEIIENDILTGNLVEEEQAPSTNEFAKIYNINPSTARKGLNILVDEEILYKKRGIGMFVTADGKKKILKKRQASFFKERLPDIIKEAQRLEIDHEKIIDYIKNMEEEHND